MAVKKGTKITSTDPQAGGTLHFTSNSNDKLTYSYNYVKITSVYLYIEYTILGSTLTSYNDTMVVNKSYNFSISGVNTYYHDLTLKVGQKKVSLISNQKIGDYEIKIPKDIANGFSESAVQAEATITLTTYSKSITEPDVSVVGQNSYSITLNLTEESEVGPSNPKFSINTELNYLKSGETELEIIPSASFNYGSVIKEYSLKWGDLESYNLNTIGSTTITTPTASNGTKSVLVLTVTDSRGFTTSYEYEQELFITVFSKPTISIKKFYRCKNNGERDDIGGIYCYVAWEANLPNIYKYDGTIVSQTATITSSNSNFETTNLLKSEQIFGKFQTSKSYDITFYISSNITNQTNNSKKYTLQSAAFLLHFRKNQNSVGIGQVAEEINNTEYDGLFSVGWNTIFNRSVELKQGLKSPLALEYGGTGVGSEDGLKKMIGNLMYPVGSIYMSVSPENPSSIFGGTWEAWGAGRVPVGVDTSNEKFNVAEKKEGEYIQKQTNILGVTLASRSSKNLYNNNLNIKEQWPNLETLYSTAQYSGDYDSYSKNTSTEINVGEKVIIPELETSTLQPYVTCYMWKRTA